MINGCCIRQARDKNCEPFSIYISSPLFKGTNSKFSRIKESRKYINSCNYVLVKRTCSDNLYDRISPLFLLYIDFSERPIFKLQRNNWYYLCEENFHLTQCMRNQTSAIIWRFQEYYEISKYYFLFGFWFITSKDNLCNYNANLTSMFVR